MNHSQGGFVAISKDGIAYPGTSNLDFEPHLTFAVTTVTALSSQGTCNLYANVTTDVLVDVIGYYR